MYAADVLAGVHGVPVAPVGRDHQAFHVGLGMRRALPDEAPEPGQPCPRAARRAVRQARYQRSGHLRDRGDLAVHMRGGRHRRAQRQPLHQKPQIGGDPPLAPVGPSDSAQASQSADPFGTPR